MNIKKNTISHYSVILTTLVIVNAENYNLILSFIITVLALYGLKKPEEIIPTFFLTSLASDYFVAFSGVGFTRLFSVILILSFLLNNPRLIVKKNWLLEILFISYATILTYLFSNNMNVYELLSFVLNILLFLVFVNYEYREEVLASIFRNIGISAIIMVIFGGIQLYVNPNFLSNGRLSLNEDLNENRFAMMYSQLSAFLIGFTFLISSKKIKFIMLSLSGIGIYLVILSGSRSAFLGILLGTVASIMLLLIKDKKRRRILILLPVIGFVGYVFFDWIISSNELLSYRFNIDQVASSGGTRRLPRIITELKYVIPNNIMFGVGLSANNEFIETAKYMSDPGSSHNIIISMLAQMGIFGFLAYMSFYFKIIKELIHSLKMNVRFIIPIILILTAMFNGIGEVIYNDRLFWSALSLGGLCINTMKKSLH